MQDASPLVLFGKKVWRSYLHLLGRLARKRGFRSTYMLTCFLILTATTIFWAVLGARLQSHNADQLSDPYLFSSIRTFHGAVFPTAHTFLIKWPLFLLVAAFGATQTSLLIATVGLVLFTVLSLAAILYKIDRRPLVFGTVCLALTTALLLVPAQAYPGGLLPVNMAMLTTRNLEYIVYIASLLFFAKTRSWRSRNLLIAVLLLIFLIASDKLFAGLSVAGAACGILAYGIRRNRPMMRLVIYWFVGSLVATLLATLLLGIIAKTGLTHFSGSSVAPYGVTHSSKNLVLGVAYGLLGLLTNVGANPVYDNRLLSTLPGTLVHRLWSLTSFVYVVASCLGVYALWTALANMRVSLRPKQKNLPSLATILSQLLVWSTLAAGAIFVVSNHYYAVDARYLTIGLFALVISVSVWLRSKTWRWPEDLLLIGCGLLVVIVVAIGVTLHVSNQQEQALSTVKSRNHLVVQALQRHKVSVLVGDYWRVLPIRLFSGNHIQAMPLATCTGSTPTLTSAAWQPNLRTRSFAYLVTFDSASLTSFPHCGLPQITAAYGQPNATQIIAGTLARPAEMLLFYDQGIRPTPLHTTRASKPTPILPVGLAELPDTACSTSTVMNVVAHQDDDLLFLSPDLLHDVQSDRCVRTVFLTAGDGGYGKFYWLSRQLGSEAAYGAMLGNAKMVWNQRTVRLASNEYVTIATPRGNSRISLIFFDLPDGDLQGQGFASSGHESLAELYDGDLTTIKSVDGSSTYTSSQLTNALSLLMTVYTPSTVHTQADVVDQTYPDHSDHITTGEYAVTATQAYDQAQFGDTSVTPVVRYIGYPTHSYQNNVSDEDAAQKEAAFLAYAQYDGGVCHSIDQCAETPTYRAYLARQYTEDANQP